MVAVRTTSLTDTIVSGAGVAQAGIVVTATLLVPASAQALDSTGEVIDLTPLTATTNASGVYLFDSSASPVNGVIPPGDIYQWVTGSLVALPGCKWQITYLATTIYSPSFAYSATALNPSSWVPGVTTLGLIKMWLTEVFGNATADQGQTWTVSLDADATWTGGAGVGQRVTSGQGFPVLTDSNGNFFTYLQRQSELNPSTGHWIATPQSGSGQAISFTSPTLYTGDQGVYAGGTTYAINNVVREAATDIPYISQQNGNVGHALSATSWWLPYSGEKITAHQVPPLNGTGAAYTTDILLHTAMVTPRIDDPVQSPGALTDDLHNLDSRFPGARRTITTSAALNAVTDDNVFANAAGGAIAPTLPLAANRTRKLYVIKIDNTANVTITATGGNLINGAATLVLSTQYQWAVLESDGGTNWYAQTGTGSGGSSAFSFVAKTANYALTTSDSGIAGDGTSNTVALTLPTAVGATQLYAIKAINLAHAVTVAPAVGGQTIDGVSLLTLTALEQTLVFASDGANWQIEAGYTPSPFTGKGDLAAGLAGGGVARLAVSGTNGNVLTEDSTQTMGLKFAPPAVGKIYGPLVDSGGLMIRDSAGTPLLAAR